MRIYNAQVRGSLADRIYARDERRRYRPWSSSLMSDVSARSPRPWQWLSISWCGRTWRIVSLSAPSTLWHRQHHEALLNYFKCQVILSWNPSSRVEELDSCWPGEASKAGNVPRNNPAVVVPSRRRKFESDFEIKRIRWSLFPCAQWLKKIRIKKTSKMNKKPCKISFRHGWKDFSWSVSL